MGWQRLVGFLKCQVFFFGKREAYLFRARLQQEKNSSFIYVMEYLRAMKCVETCSHKKNAHVCALTCLHVYTCKCMQVNVHTNVHTMIENSNFFQDRKHCQKIVSAGIDPLPEWKRSRPVFFFK